MVVVPQRLLDLDFVEVVHRSEDLTVIRKRVTEAMYERPSYVTQHALSIVDEGEQVVYDERGGVRLRIAAGEVGLMRRGLYSITDVLTDRSGGFATTVVFFSDALLQNVLGANSTKPPDVSASLTQLKNPPPFARLLASTDLQTAVMSWLRSIATDPSGLAALRSLTHRHKRPLREFMHEHFDKPLQLADYAYLTGRSERSFRRDFRTRFGESPKTWLVERRLARAKELLQTGEQSVGGVANAVGYQSTSHFIERYRERFGVTPGRGRTRKLEKKLG